MTDNEIHLKKRQRTENWVDKDKVLLTKLIRERIHDIENRNADTNHNRRKRLAWLDLQRYFNAMCIGMHRSVAQLKTQWTTLKIQARKKRSIRKFKIWKKGAPTSNDIKIDEWLPRELSPDKVESDSDSPAEDQKANDSSDTQPDPQRLVASLINCEPMCRNELHKVQMANEMRKARNLELKFAILQEKLKFYKNKNKE